MCGAAFSDGECIGDEGDDGRVWGEWEIVGGGGDRKVVEANIWTLSVSICDSTRDT